MPSSFPVKRASHDFRSPPAVPSFGPHRPFLKACQCWEALYRCAVLYTPVTPVAEHFPRSFRPVPPGFRKCVESRPGSHPILPRTGVLSPVFRNALKAGPESHPILPCTGVLRPPPSRKTISPFRTPSVRATTAHFAFNKK